MMQAGNDLRVHREQLGMSQARLSELSGVPQHLLSSYELGKITLNRPHIEAVQGVILNHTLHTDVISRRKRYKAHTYEGKRYDINRRLKCLVSENNQKYVKNINNLMFIPKPSFVGLSLFSGCGGLSLGFQRAGCDIKGFVEINDQLAKIYAENFASSTRLGSDISAISNDAIRCFVAQNGQIDVLIGGPPCQGFSLSGKRRTDDPRNYLFQDYMRILEIVNPRVAIIENVRLLTSMRSKAGTLVMDDILSDFSKIGYRTRSYEINAKDYGVPQHRERVIFVAVRKDLKTDPTIPFAICVPHKNLFDDKSDCMTFADACSDLEYLESGQSSLDAMHDAVSHPDHVIDWLWDVPEGASAHDNIDPSKRPPSGYNTTYKRQIWNEPGSTVQTTFGMISGCRNVHPIATRSLTVREAARLQTFPDSYKFVGSLGTIRTGIGNAVPPLLAFVIARHIRTQLLKLVEIPSF